MAIKSWSNVSENIHYTYTMMEWLKLKTIDNEKLNNDKCMGFNENIEMMITWQIQHYHVSFVLFGNMIEICTRGIWFKVEKNHANMLWFKYYYYYYYCNPFDIAMLYNTCNWIILCTNSSTERNIICPCSLVWIRIIWSYPVGYSYTCVECTNFWRGLTATRHGDTAIILIILYLRRSC